MSRNTEANIKKHNDKLHKAQDKAKAQVVARKEKLKAIVKKFNNETLTNKVSQETEGFSSVQSSFKKQTE